MPSSGWWISSGVDVVYFIFSPDDPRSLVKIGFTGGSIEERIHALQCGNPFRLCLIMALEGGKDLEQHLHRKFAASRCHGEWFYPTEDLRAFIRVCLGANLDAALIETLNDLQRVSWQASVLGWSDDEVREGLQALLAS
jgi:Meiotically up-regulated gene 113